MKEGLLRAARGIAMRCRRGNRRTVGGPDIYQFWRLELILVHGPEKTHFSHGSTRKNTDKIVCFIQQATSPATP
jgi:hypothetical protein